MKSIDHAEVKFTFLTHAVELTALAGVKPLTRAPRLGDLVLTEVIQPGHHTRIEDRGGRSCDIFPGDQIVGAFGNRYATDQFEGYVPQEPVSECHLMSIGGVCGRVVSQQSSMDPPTTLRVHGAVCGPDGQPLNLRAFGLPGERKIPVREGRPEIVLIVGSSMNSGKTTTVGTLARAFRQGGFRVAAAKVTGTAAGKDGRYFASCGAKPVLDFTFAGYPSTYMLELEELLMLYRTLVSELSKTNPDYILIELADGIFQRETQMMLECEAFRKKVDHVFFAAGDSLAIECGVRALRRYALPLRATSGLVTKSPLGMREAEAVTGLPCLNIERMMTGEAVAAIRPGDGTMSFPRPELVQRNGNGNGARVGKDTHAVRSSLPGATAEAPLLRAGVA